MRLRGQARSGKTHTAAVIPMKIQLIKEDDLKEKAVSGALGDAVDNEKGRERVIGSRRVHYQRSGDMTV